LARRIRMTRVQRGALYVSVRFEFRWSPSDAMLTRQGKKTSKQRMCQSDEPHAVRD